jgi:ribosomal 50S subunit-recycling heat shock protein
MRRQGARYRQLTPKSGGKRHRQRVNINAISNHMLASIRWQIAPWWGESASLGDSVSVFQFVSPPHGAQATAGIWPAICRYDARWHRPACANARAVWTKLQTNQPLTQHAQVKHIIGGKPSSDRTPAAPAPAARLVEVDEDSSGQRLDNFLIRQLKGVPKTHVYRIIRSGEVRINKGRVNADTRVEAGDVVRLPPVRISDKVAEKAERPAPAREFPILLEDEHLIALDKPAGVAVHGGSGVSFGVIEQLRQARPQARFLELVHRLDRETSGILLVAKKRSALTHLQDQFRERETGKTYLALVTGPGPPTRR